MLGLSLCYTSLLHGAESVTSLAFFGFCFVLDASSFIILDRWLTTRLCILRVQLPTVWSGSRSS